MITMAFMVDNERSVEIVTQENMVDKLYSLLRSNKRCSAIHTYSQGIELDPETGNIKEVTNDLSKL